MTLVPTRYDVTDPAQRESGLTAATTAIRAGELVVMPTDTVYGLAADAFDPAAVRRLLDAKGRGREMPPPVLVGSVATLDALASALPSWGSELVEHYWPGPLTIVVRQQSSLQWDLGETRGTVAVRMPHDPVALELLGRTGPLAVSSANLTGRPAATDADQAADMLADRVSVILDSGPTLDDRPSSIVDCTGAQPRLLRVGAVPVAELRSVLSASGVAVDDLTEAPGPVEADPAGSDPEGTDSGA